MTDLDAIKRTLADLEKRIRRIETRLWPHQVISTISMSVPHKNEQWCRCGRDVCRYPACSSKVASVADDPLGR